MVTYESGPYTTACVLSYVQLVLNFVKQSKGFFGMQFDIILIFV
jgi:hypothetical protein